MPAPTEIGQLVELFEHNYEQHLSLTFTEAAARHQFIDPADVAPQDRMIPLVTQTAAVVDLHKRLAAEGVPQQKAALQRRIEMTDRKIDALVYELYGLTPEEIKVVEGV